jgi:hypothetical protein
MKRALVLVVLFAACSSGGTKTAPTSTATSPSTTVQCSTVFAVGKVLDEAAASAGCYEGAALQANIYINCTDGRHLYQRTVGGVDLYGFAGEAMQTMVKQTGPQDAADPGYKAAYAACTG